MTSPLRALRKDETPGQFVLRLAREEASGELIVVDDSTQVHVFLEQGRFAWATSSSGPLAFSHYLVERGGVDRRRFAEAVERARRQGLRLGELLVGEGLATAAQIRAALLEQLAAAFRTLPSGSEVRAVFLPTAEDASPYARELTFELEELAPVLATVGAESPEALLAGLARDLPEARWIQIFWNGAPVVSRSLEPATALPASLAGFADLALEQRARLCVVRSLSFLLYGMALDGPGTSAWCALPGEIKLGLVHRVLAARRPVENGLNAEPGPDLGGPIGSVVDGLPERTLSVLAQGVRETPELAAAVLLDPIGGGTACAARGGEPAARAAVDPAARLADLLECRELARLVESLDHGQDLVSGTPLALHRDLPGSREFAGRVLTPTSRTVLWLRLAPGAPQGLGWALLTALTRRLEETTASA